MAEEFTDHLVREVSTLVVGEPGAGDEVEIGPMVSKAHFDRVSGFLARAAAAGITAAVGGTPLDGPGYFIPPTVLIDIPGNAECAREEIFGPVVTVETFEEEDEAVSRANEVPHGLAASIFTENARRGLDIPLQARLRHGLGQLAPRPGHRGTLGRIQGLRLRPRPVPLRTRRLLPHQTRHAQPRTLTEPVATRRASR